MFRKILTSNEGPSECMLYNIIITMRNCKTKPKDLLLKVQNLLSLLFQYIENLSGEELVPWLWYLTRNKDKQAIFTLSSMHVHFVQKSNVYSYIAIIALEFGTFKGLYIQHYLCWFQYHDNTIIIIYFCLTMLIQC